MLTSRLAKPGGVLRIKQAETAGDIACCRCLQEECDADGEGDHGDGDLSALDPAS